MSKLLEGKNALVTGLISERSIAWAIIKAFQGNGANVVGSAQNREIKKRVQTFEECPPMIVMDAGKNRSIKNGVTDAVKIFDDQPIDCLVHCLAFAKKKELQGRYIDGKRGRAMEAYSISVESLRIMTQMAEPFMARDGSIIYLTFAGSERVYPYYNTMGVMKAALECAGRYLAPDLAASNRIRINGISAGPERTLAATAVEGFRKIGKFYELRAPLGNVPPENIAGMAVCLASDLSQGVTGEIIHVDGGFHAMAIGIKEEQTIENKKEIG